MDWPIFNSSLSLPHPFKDQGGSPSENFPAPRACGLFGKMSDMDYPKVPPKLPRGALQLAAVLELARLSMYRQFKQCLVRWGGDGGAGILGELRVFRPQALPTRSRSGRPSLQGDHASIMPCLHISIILYPSLPVNPLPN